MTILEISVLKLQLPLTHIHLCLLAITNFRTLNNWKCVFKPEPQKQKDYNMLRFSVYKTQKFCLTHITLQFPPVCTTADELTSWSLLQLPVYRSTVGAYTGNLLHHWRLFWRRGHFYGSHVVNCRWWLLYWNNCRWGYECRSYWWSTSHHWSWRRKHLSRCTTSRSTATAREWSRWMTPRNMMTQFRINSWRKGTLLSLIECIPRRFWHRKCTTWTLGERKNTWK